MKFLPALFALGAVVIAGPAAAAPKTDWTRTVTATPVGFVMGNPKAKVTLVEYGSYTCPHCAAFQQDGVPALKSRYIASGKVRFEFRSFVRNGPDYAASLLALCDRKAVVARTDALFSGQKTWAAGYAALTEADAARLQKMPKNQQIPELARVGGLTAFVTKLGLPPARAAKCLADQGAADRLTATLKAAVETDKINGTPGFLINGKRQVETTLGQERGVTTWDALEPLLVQSLR